MHPVCKNYLCKYINVITAFFLSPVTLVLLDALSAMVILAFCNYDNTLSIGFFQQ